MGIVFMKPTDPDWGARGVTVSGALPSQLRAGCNSFVCIICTVILCAHLCSCTLVMLVAHMPSLHGRETAS